MFSPFRRIFWISVVAASLAATPAYAADTGGLLTEVQGDASEAAWAITVYMKALAAGDMPHIHTTSFALSGLIGLIGLWLLIVRPRVRFVESKQELDESDGTEPPVETVADSSPESDADRPTRLLEAIAAAKAQMSISEAEKKHAR